MNDGRSVLLSECRTVFCCQVGGSTGAIKGRKNAIGPDMEKEFYYGDVPADKSLRNFKKESYGGHWRGWRQEEAIV